MSRDGMGFEIGFAYTNFDNATMYPLIVLMLHRLDHRQPGCSARGRSASCRRRGLR